MVIKRFLQYSVLLIATGIFITACGDSNGEDSPPPSDLNDDEVITCRFSSIYGNDNCDDFPESEGWDTTSVEETCSSLFDGIDEETVVVATADSCLIEMSAKPSIGRCKILADDQYYYAFAISEVVCTDVMEGEYESGPFGNYEEYQTVLTLSEYSVSVNSRVTVDVTASITAINDATDKVESADSSDPAVAIASLTDLTISITGVKAGTATITVSTESGGSAKISVTVISDPPVLNGYSTPVAEYTVNNSITDNIPDFTGFTGSGIFFTIKPDLPAGVNLDVTTGIISGTPSGLQDTTLHTITASTFDGTDTFDVSITVNNFGLTYTEPDVTYNNTYALITNEPVVTGGTYDYYTITPALPAGLVMNAYTGVISGAPTELSPSIDYTISAYNSYGGTIPTIIVITIAVNRDPPSDLSYPFVDALYSVGSVIESNKPNVRGNVTSYSVDPIELWPTGLVFNTSNGVISGTPSTPQAQTTYSITAANDFGSSDPFDISITVNYGLAYEVIDADYTLDESITDNNPVISGGGNFDSYSIDPSLSTATGLDFNTTTGVISGTPTIVADDTYVVTATNSIGDVTTTLFIEVSPLQSTQSTTMDALLSTNGFATDAPNGVSGVPPSTDSTFTYDGTTLAGDVLFGYSVIILAPGQFVEATVAFDSISLSIAADGTITGTTTGGTVLAEAGVGTGGLFLGDDVFANLSLNSVTDNGDGTLLMEAESPLGGGLVPTSYKVFLLITL